MFKTSQGHMSGPVLCYQKNSTFLEITLHLSIYLYSQMIKVRGSGQWLQISFRNPSDEITIKTTKNKNKNKISIKTQTVTPDLETSREIKETTSYRISSLLSPPNYSDEMMMMIWCFTSISTYQDNGRVIMKSSELWSVKSSELCSTIHLWAEFHHKVWSPNHSVTFHSNEIR